jgi:hypothetical protein
MMVIDGIDSQENEPTIAQFEGRRILLPLHFVKHAALSGSKPIDCWLLVVTPGRFRLVKQSTATPTGDLAKILSQSEEVGEPGDVLDYTESNPQAAIRARLIPCVATPRGPGWRLNFPKSAMELVPATEERSSVFLLTVAGYVELWFPETLRRAVSEPFSKVLS